jgi:hypothetical protein
MRDPIDDKNLRALLPELSVDGILACVNDVEAVLGGLGFYVHIEGV